MPRKIHEIAVIPAEGPIVGHPNFALRRGPMFRGFENHVLYRADPNLAPIIRAIRIALLPTIFLIGSTCAAETTGAMQPSRSGVENGFLEGRVTLACGHDVPGCEERPYPVELFIQNQQAGTAPMHVEAKPDFRVSLSPGVYTVSSADARSWRALPTLKPITVRIRSGGVTHVDLRFQPVPQLPTR
jgi:hypothetical protein